MKKIIIGIIILITVIIFWYFSNNTKSITQQTVSSPTPSSPQMINDVDISATFKIITNGTTRIFTDPKYHNLSKDVYITSQNPNTVVVKKTDIKWSDFFKTLPMSLNKDCLITGTKQTFCTSGTGKLYFYINNVETPNALNNPIRSNDFLLVEYK